MGFFKKFVKAVTDPVTIVTAVALVLTAGTIGTLGTIASFAVYASATAAISALSPTPEMPTFGGYGSFVSEARSRTQMIKQPAQPRRVVYGEVRVSGVLVFAETTNNDEFIHLVIAVAGHEIDSFQTFRIDEDTVTLTNTEVTAPSRFLDGSTKLVNIYTKTGADNQTAQTQLVADVTNWTSNHRMRGIAYIYAKLKFSSDAFPNGLPNISSKIRGKKVFDPRTSNSAFSSNPALCIRDYLTDTRYGLGCSASEIDDTSFIAAANTCEEQVTLAAGGNQNRYELHGSFDSSFAPKEIIEKMLKSCGGILTYTNGKFRLRVAEFRTPSVTLTEDDIRDTIKLSPKMSQSENFNAIKGVFSPSTNDYIPTDYPPITSTTFENEDNGERRFLDYDLPYTTDFAMAQRLAKIALFRSREQMSLELATNLKGFQLDVGDTVNVTLPRFGFTNKVFEVAEWNLNIDATQGLGVNLLLKETSASVYSWNADEATFTENNTTLPDPFGVSAPTVTATDTVQTFQQKAITVLEVTVSSTDTYANQFEVSVKKSTDSVFESLGVSSQSLFTLVDVEDGATYDIRARAISSFGIKSSFTSITRTIAGKAGSPPSNVSDFSLNYMGTQAKLSWTAVTDPDLSHYRVRHQAVTSGGTFNTAVDLAGKVARPATSVMVPALSGTYFCVAVDKYGNTSTLAASTIGIIDEAPVASDTAVISTTTEATSFTGSKTNVLLDVDTNDRLILDTSINFDSAAGNFDDTVGLFDGGGGFVASSGEYEFANHVDLTNRQRVRITPTITSTTRQYVTSSILGLTNVEMFVNVTDDDPAGSPTYKGFQRLDSGDFVGRGFKFKIKMTTSNAQHTPEVTGLSVQFLADKRQESSGDIASGTASGGKIVTFGNAFHAISGISISAQNLATGDFYQITNKTVSGFTIVFKDNSNTVVNRTFDFVADGFGYRP